MIEWLGIGHLFELSRSEAIWGFFTPLVIFAVFFLVQLILPGRRVPGYVINPETGEPRNYRLNGILVFAIALIVWALELTGMPRDWFYRSAIYAVAGGTVFATIFALIAVFSQPQGKMKNPIAALWLGRVQELSFFQADGHLLGHCHLRQSKAEVLLTIIWVLLALLLNEHAVAASIQEIE